MKSIYLGGGLMILGLLVGIAPIGKFPTLGIPGDLEPKYQYGSPEPVPECREYCAPLDCLGSIGCFKEAKRTGCSIYGEFGCAPCPKDSDCYQYNLAQDARYQSYVDAHWPADTDDWRLARTRVGVGLLMFLCGAVGIGIPWPPSQLPAG